MNIESSGQTFIEQTDRQTTKISISWAPCRSQKELDFELDAQEMLMLVYRLICAMMCDEEAGCNMFRIDESGLCTFGYIIQTPASEDVTAEDSEIEVYIKSLLFCPNEIIYITKGNVLDGKIPHSRCFSI